jgi:uncharacterized protein (DUF58 family)
MLPKELVAEIRLLELKAGRLVTDALAGNYLSAFRGRGMEFDEVREYTPGDDVRTIDWNVTARLGTPYVKVLREERELTMVALVDVSPSQAFGSRRRTKLQAAAEMAAILAFLAIRSNDKVGLVAFSDHVETFVPPKKGRAHVWSIISTILSHQGKGRGTDLGGALDFLTRVSKRRATVFVISDFWAQGFETQLSAAARRHDVIAAITRDPAERALPEAGLVLYRDLESGREALVDTSSRRARESYERALVAADKRLQDVFRRCGVDSFPIEVGGAAGQGASTVQALARYLRLRDQKRRRHG